MNDPYRATASCDHSLRNGSRFTGKREGVCIEGCTEEEHCRETCELFCKDCGAQLRLLTICKRGVSHVRRHPNKWLTRIKEALGW